MKRVVVLLFILGMVFSTWHLGIVSADSTLSPLPSGAYSKLKFVKPDYDSNYYVNSKSQRVKNELEVVGGPYQGGVRVIGKLSGFPVSGGGIDEGISSMSAEEYLNAGRVAMGGYEGGGGHYMELWEEYTN